MKKVLFLDATGLAPYFRDIMPEEEYEFTTEADLGNQSIYKPTQNLLIKIRELSSSGKVDLILLGNNLGAGLQKAANISATMRDRTLVYANLFAAGEKEEYEAMGFKYFSRRDSYLELKGMLSGL